MTTRAAVYARQSHGSRKSIAEQIDECRADADENGWQIIEPPYVDITSASRYARRERPHHARLIADVTAGLIDVIVMWEPSRADRRLTAWSELLDLCRDRDVRIRITDHGATYDPREPRDWQTLATDGVTSAVESDKTSRRNGRTARSAAKLGKPNGPTPYGFRRRYDPENPRAGVLGQDPDPATESIVVEIIRRIGDGEPIKPMAEELTARGVLAPGRRGPEAKPWTAHAIRALARNRAYVGQRIHKPNGSGEATVHATEIWPPLVTEVEFWRAQRVLDDRAAQWRRPSRQHHLLTGVPICGVCGSPLGGSVDKPTGGRKYGCRAKGCVYVDGPGLESLVLAHVLGRLARPDVWAELAAAADGDDAEAARARAEAERLRGELAAWQADAAAGRITRASFLAVEPGLVGRIDAAERRVESSAVPPAVRDLVDAEDLPERWAAMPMAARRDVVSAVVRIVVGRGVRGHRVPVEDRVTITWKGAVE